MNDKAIDKIVYKNTRKVQDENLKLINNYNTLLEFVKQLADESVYDLYENLNHMNWDAFELLKEIGES